MPDLITVPEAALRLGISRIAVYQAIREGRLPASTVLGRIALHPDDVAAYRPGQRLSPQAVQKIVETVADTFPATPHKDKPRMIPLPAPRRNPPQPTLPSTTEGEDWDQYL